jgi:hypothetical protein
MERRSQKVGVAKLRVAVTFYCCSVDTWGAATVDFRELPFFFLAFEVSEP